MAKWTLHKRADNGKVYVHWREDGKLIRKSADTLDLKLARKRAPEIVAGHFASPTLPAKLAEAKKVRAGDVTMNMVFDRCERVIWTEAKVRSQATLMSTLRILRSMIGGERLQAMTYGRLERLVEELRARGYAEGTIQRKMNCVSAALTQATKEVDEDEVAWLLGRPAMPRLVVDNFKDRVLSKAEEHAVLKAIEKRVRKQPTRYWRRFGYLIRFLLDTGCRLAEALSLTEERIERHVVDGVERWAALFPRYGTKNKRPRVVWLTKAVIKALPYLRMTAVDGRVFPILSQTAWSMWDTIRDDVREAGCDLGDKDDHNRVVLHTMRHTCLTRMAKTGKFRIEQISDWAGHSKIQITIDRYRHLLPTDSAFLVDYLDEIAA